MEQPDKDAGLLDSIIKQAKEKGTDFSEALVVRMSRALQGMKALGMYGKRLYDKVTPSSERKEIYDTVDHKEHNWFDVTPFGKTGASVNCIVTYQDKNTGERYVLMGRKPTTQFFHFPGGYIQPHPPGEDTLKDTASYDNNIYDIGIRELKEETGLAWPKDKKPEIIGEPVSQYGIAEGVKCQHIWYAMLFDFGKQESLPLGENRDDLINPHWVNIKDIQFQEAYTEHGVSHAKVTVPDGNEKRLVRPLHAPYLEKAIEMVEDKERTLPLHAMKRVAEHSSSKTIRDILDAPQSLFTKEAVSYRERIAEADKEITTKLIGR